MKYGWILLVLACFATQASAQWLPEAEQKRLRAMWDQTGVDFPQGGKFYALPRVSQRLVTVNNVECNGIYDDAYRESGENINRQLAAWATEGVIELTQGKIRIIDPDYLTQIAEAAE